MALRYRKSIKLGKGVKLNIGKKSAGISLGGKYGGVSFNTRNGARVRASAPGTGLSYSEKVRTDMGKKKHIKDFDELGDNEELYPDTATPKEKKRKRWIIWASVIFVLGIIGACGDNDSPTPAPTATITPTAIVETKAPEQTKEPEQTQKPANTQKPEKTPAPKSTAKPKKDTPAVIPDDDEEEEMVWIPTNGGSKYHSKASCSNMDDPDCVSINEAKSMGFTPCKRCYG